MFIPTLSSSVIVMGPFVSDTDGKTAQTSLSLTVYLSKDGAASVARHSTTAITHDRLGYYLVPLDSTDTGFVGRLAAFATPTGALPVRQNYFVVNQDYYLAVGSGGLMPADVRAWDEDNAAVATAKALFLNTLAMGNLADFFDGTGYDADNSTIGTVTNAPTGSGDVLKLGGSTTALANLKKMFDGTGFAAAASSIGSVGSVGGTVNANLTNINGTAALFTAFQHLLKGAVYGIVVAGTNTSTVISTSLTATTSGLYLGKMLIVTSGARLGEGGKLVTAYDGSTKRLTVQAMTGALAPGDTFVLVG